MDLRTRLDILLSQPQFTDISADAQDFRRDNISLQLQSLDLLYVGFRKPINALYFAFEEAGADTHEIQVEYFSKDGWKVLQIADGTKGFSRNGFVSWNRVSDADKSAVNDVSNHWLRISVNQTSGEPAPLECVLQGLNLVFSDDNDISAETPALVDPRFVPKGQNSHILQHVATKNYIIGRLRNLGYVKHINDNEENIDQWDILDIYEIRNAANYYTISQIYFNLSDNPDDQYWNKYKEYERKFEESFSLARLRIDQNDDGQVNLDEKRPRKTIRWVR